MDTRYGQLDIDLSGSPNDVLFHPGNVEFNFLSALLSGKD